ncbi:MAG: hypothetical protein QNJ61_18230 [Desulfobacterales bacterium]|nr:hypothetical protein [Desulfobacterales bacterium]
MKTAKVFGLVVLDAAVAGQVENRQVRQHKHIHQGVHSGELTKRETIRLPKEQRISTAPKSTREATGN